MGWVGTWRNQYGSTVAITRDDGGRIEGVFRTAIEDSPFYGTDAAILGTVADDVIGFSSAIPGGAGAVAVSYTGIMREGKMEAMWYVVASAALTAAHPGAPAEVKRLDAWRAFTANLDTFERVD